MLVRVSSLRMRCLRAQITPVPESPQDPLAEPAGWLAALCLLGLSLVKVAEPDRSWGASSPNPSHPAIVSSERS